MAHPYTLPSWFFGYNIGLELAFAIITLIVSFFAFKIYRLTDQRQSKLFGYSFLFISAAYFLESLLNFLIVSKLNDNISIFLKMQDVFVLNNAELFTHMLMFMMGLLTLTYMTLKTKNTRTFIILIAITILALIFSTNRLYLFYLIATVLLIFICIHYVQNYFKNKQTNTLLVLTAFLFLLFGHFHFIISVDHALFYIIGHFLELAAYLLILANLLLVLRK